MHVIDILIFFNYITLIFNLQLHAFYFNLYFVLHGTRVLQIGEDPLVYTASTNRKEIRTLWRYFWMKRFIWLLFLEKIFNKHACMKGF